MNFVLLEMKFLEPNTAYKNYHINKQKKYLRILHFKATTAEPYLHDLLTIKGKGFSLSHNSIV